MTKKIEEKTKELSLQDVFTFCQKADKSSLLQLNTAVIKLLSGNGNSSANADSIIISRDDKKITINGRLGSIARQVAGLLFGTGTDDTSVNPALAFTGRITAAFTRRTEFNKVINALMNAGYKIEKFPETIND